MEGFKQNMYNGESSPDREDIRQEYKKEENEKELTGKEKEAINSVREVVEDIDQGVLAEIFRELYGKVGNNIDSLHISDVSKIDYEYDEEKNSLGYYGPLRGVVLNAARLVNKDSYSIENTLIHECVHEVTTLPSQQTWYETGDDVSYEAEEIGYSGVSKTISTARVDKKSSTYSSPSSYDSHGPINEGITQIITDDIHNEYRKRIGVSNETGEQPDFTEVSNNAYPEEQFNVYIYIPGNYPACLPSGKTLFYQ